MFKEYVASLFFLNLLHFVFTSFNTVRSGDAQLQLLSSADVLYEFGAASSAFVTFTTNSTEEIPLCAFILFPIGFFNLICFMAVGAAAVCIYLRMRFRAFLSLVFVELCFKENPLARAGCVLSVSLGKCSSSVCTGPHKSLPFLSWTELVFGMCLFPVLSPLAEHSRIKINENTNKVVWILSLSFHADLDATHNPFHMKGKS